jgi:hypothetical protein
MSITAYSQRRVSRTTYVTVTSSLSGTIYYHWYLDGIYLGVTNVPTKGIMLEASEQARIECVDTTNAVYDGASYGATDYPARRILSWVRSVDSSVVAYVIRQKKAAGSYADLARVHDRGEWSYQYTTPRLDDLTEYTWQIVPVDASGNEGSALTIGPELIVRTPDSPRFSTTWDADESTLTVAAVA